MYFLAMFGWKSGDSRKRRKNSYTSCRDKHTEHMLVSANTTANHMGTCTGTDVRPGIRDLRVKVFILYSHLFTDRALLYVMGQTDLQLNHLQRENHFTLKLSYTHTLSYSVPAGEARQPPVLVRPLQDQTLLQSGWRTEEGSGTSSLKTEETAVTTTH